MGCGAALPALRPLPARPLGIVVLASLHGLAAGLAAFLAGVVLAGSGLRGLVDLGPLEDADPRVAGGLLLAAAVLATVVAYGLLVADVWAWALALVSVGGYATLGVWSALQGRVTALPAVLLALAAGVYLAQRDVRGYLRHG